MSRFIKLQVAIYRATEVDSYLKQLSKLEEVDEADSWKVVAQPEYPMHTAAEGRIRKDTIEGYHATYLNEDSLTLDAVCIETTKGTFIALCTLDYLDKELDDANTEN